MKGSKSESKFKIATNKYENFFTQKNWNDPMYMDLKNAEVEDAQKAILKSYSSLSIQPKAKLSLSLNEKVGIVLSDSRKMGMIEKVNSVATKKSLAKISLVSSLPPIKTQVQQTQQHLRKVKNQLNEVSLKTIKLSKQVSNMQASTYQIIEKSRVIQQILSKTGQKQEQQIRQKNQVTDAIKYDYDVRKNMYENLKSDIRIYSKCKHLLNEKLKNLKIHITTLNTQLNNSTSNLNSNIFTKRQYQKHQELESQQIMIKSDIAQAKLTHQFNAEKIKKKLQNLQKYNQDIFHYETNLDGHFKLLSQLRAQQILARIMTTLYHKYQAKWSDCQKANALMKMHSNMNQYPEHFKTLRNESTIKANQSSLKNSSFTVSNNQTYAEFDLISAYNGTFTTKSEVDQKIAQKQKLIKDLEKKRSELFTKFIQVTFQDTVTQGNKPVKKFVNQEKQIKKLIERDKRVDRNKLVQSQINAWVARQEDKFGLQFSKKMNAGQRIVSIIQYVREESKKFMPAPKQNNDKGNQVSNNKTKVSTKK